MQVVVIVGSTEKAALSLCSLLKITQIAQVVVIVGSTEKAALSLCSLVGYYPDSAGCTYCRQYREGCTFFVQSGRRLPR